MSTPAPTHYQPTGSGPTQHTLERSMKTVADMLRESAEQWRVAAESIRYDEPHGLRHALDVHLDFLRDMAAELERPGRTKYSPLMDGEGER